MIKSKKQMYVIIGAFILTLLLGTTTYAFFNYTRTGTANNIRTGRVSFNTSQDGSINLTNAFPISSTQAQTDTTNAKSVSITVTGDTDYANGLEYLVTASDVNLTIGAGANAKTLPIALEVSVSSNTHGEAPNQITTTLGTAETGDYYTNRSSYTVSKYKILYDGELEEDTRILVGYIAPNTTSGTPSGIDGTINIKAYIDSSKILISDTYPSGDVDINNDNEIDYTNGTPASMATNKVEFTTEEWNSIQGSPLSFKVKIESNEGIWVESPQIPICRKAINLHSTPCNASGTAGCKGNSATSTTITYGNLWDGTSALSSGDALDCDVTGTGTYERFYYVTSTGSGSSKKAVLIYYTNISNDGTTISPSSQTYYNNDSTDNWHGPRIAYQYLPSTIQWSNSQIIAPMANRQIVNENGNTTAGGETIQTFTYSNRAARFLTYQEVQNACGAGTVNTNGYLDNCNYLLENVQTYETSTGSWGGIFGYWLETPLSSSTTNVWGINGGNRTMDYDTVHVIYSTNFGIRPVVEILESNISN